MNKKSNVTDGDAVTESSWQLSSDPSWLQLERVHAWLSASYWSPDIRLDLVQRAFENSVFIGAYDKREQIGVARAVTDGATFAWLCDVYVAESHRGHGIARAMVKALMAHPHTATLRRWCLATRDAHEVYRPLGFIEVPQGRWMECVLPREGWQVRRG